MVANTCAMIHLEVLWFSGNSIMGEWISNTDMITWGEVIHRRISWTLSFPKMAGAEYSLRERYGG